MADSDEMKPETPAKSPGATPPTRKEAEEKAFWKQALTVAAGVGVAAAGVAFTVLRIFRKRPRI